MKSGREYPEFKVELDNQMNFPVASFLQKPQKQSLIGANH